MTRVDAWVCAIKGARTQRRARDHMIMAAGYLRGLGVGENEPYMQIAWAYHQRMRTDRLYSGPDDPELLGWWSELPWNQPY